MTSTWWFTWFVAGPIVGAAVAVLSGGVTPTRVILAVLIGEAAAYASARLWSDRMLQRALRGGTDVLVAKADVSLAGRVIGACVLISIALGVAGLTVLLARVTGWGRAWRGGSLVV